NADGCWINMASSAFNQVAGNRITSNAGNGVAIYNGAHDNVIGNSAVGAPGNNISANGDDGVHFDGGTANFVSGDTSITANGGLGIQLLNNANDNQAAPVLASAISAGGQTTVGGKLTSMPNGSYTLQFWGNPASDPAEGKVFLGSISVTTVGGSASFSA